MHMSRLKYFSVVAAPTIISLELRAPTTVRVLWTRPELSVTGYKVHDTLAVGIGSDGTQSVGAGSTGAEITGLTGGRTYIITVEVISDSHNILPGVSDVMNITLREFIATLTHTHTHVSINKVYIKLLVRR